MQKLFWPGVILLALVIGAGVFIWGRGGMLAVGLSVDVLGAGLLVALGLITAGLVARGVLTKTGRPPER